MNKFLFYLLVLTTFNTFALDLFKAEYTVFKDGKKIGLSSIVLTYDAPFFTVIDKTNGTHGMASFLGFKRSESTLFTEENGVYYPDSYLMNQKVAFNKRKSEYQIDKQTQMAYGKYKDKDWQTKITGNFLTPNLVSIKLSQDICSGKTSNLNYPVLKRGKISNYTFKIISESDGIIEVDKIHSKATRTTKTWLDKSQNCLPIKTYHKEEDEDPLETKLIEIIFP